MSHVSHRRLRAPRAFAMDRGGGERVVRVADAKTPEMQKRIFEERLTREARHNAPRSRNFQAREGVAAV